MEPSFASAGGVCANFFTNGGDSWALYLEWESLSAKSVGRLHCAIYSPSREYVHSKCYLNAELISGLLCDLEALECGRDVDGRLARSMRDMWDRSSALPEPYGVIWQCEEEDRGGIGGTAPLCRLSQSGERIELHARFEDVELDLQLLMDANRSLFCESGQLGLDGEHLAVERLKGVLVPSTILSTAGEPPSGRLTAFIPSLPEVTETNGDPLEIEIGSWWTSGVTFERYPVEFRMLAPAVRLEFAACREKQEVQIPLGMRRMWLGFCNVEGTAYNKEIQEVCVVLFRAEGPDFSTDEVLGRANTAVMQEVDALLETAASAPIPCESTATSVPAAIRAYHDWSSVIEPIRAIAKRGGKGWRGYALALCCEAVGGDFARHKKWLAFSEILHVGSLVVDDVEDDSTIRRGGPAAHTLFGVPTAINSGSLAYFLPKHIFDATEIASETHLEIYREYVDLLRLAHVGQGLDIHLTLEALSEKPDTEEINHLCSRAVTACRLKTGIPFEKFARIGALLGSGSAEEIDALGDYFLELGLCFQIYDDILNVEGFGKKSKERGEDIRNGKLTLPIIRYLSLSEASQRPDAITLLRRARMDPSALNGVLDMVMASGAPDLCREEATARLSRAWQRLDDALPYSFAKLLIQSFSDRVLDRPY